MTIKGNVMFKVHEMMGNFSEEVAMFETEVEAVDYLKERLYDDCDNAALEEDEREAYEEDFYSYFSIEDDGRESITMDDLVSKYDDMLDELYPEMFNMSPSIILQRADKIAYDCGLNDYYDSVSDSYYCEEME